MEYIFLRIEIGAVQLVLNHHHLVPLTHYIFFAGDIENDRSESVCSKYEFTAGEARGW